MFNSNRSLIILFLSSVLVNLVAVNAAVPARDHVECVALDSVTEKEVETYNLGENRINLGAYVINRNGKYINLKEGILRENESSLGFHNSEPKMIIDFDCGHLAFYFALNENNSTFVRKIAGSFWEDGSKTNFYTFDHHFAAEKIKYSYKSKDLQTVSMRGYKDRGVRVEGISLVLKDLVYDLYTLARRN